MSDFGVEFEHRDRVSTLIDDQDPIRLARRAEEGADIHAREGNVRAVNSATASRR